MSHNPHTPTHTELTFFPCTTHLTTVLHTHTGTHTLAFHLEDISRDVRLICGLIPGRAWFRTLLMEGLIVCQLPGCQIRHVGSQQGFSSLPFMFALAFFLTQSLKIGLVRFPLERSPACHTSAIGPQCANRWHLRTEGWRVCVEGTVGITLLSTLHVLVCIRNVLLFV